MDRPLTPEEFKFLREIIALRDEARAARQCLSYVAFEFTSLANPAQHTVKANKNQNTV